MKDNFFSIPDVLNSYLGLDETKIRTDKNRDSSNILISRKRMVTDLVSIFNITPRKSLTLKPPFLINEENVWGFIIGYIDGDGCVSTSTVKRNYGKKVYQYTVLSIYGSRFILEWIKEKFDNKFPIDNPSTIRPISKKPHHQYKIEGKRAVEILNFLRSKHVPKLERKWNKHAFIYT